MTIAQFIVAYAVCWWLVLFMVLPAGAAPSAMPEKGHARSAPAKPSLKKKFRWATLLAFFPTLLIYLVATTVKAEDVIYRVGGGCKTLATHKTADDVAVRDGHGIGDRKVKPADLGGKPAFISTQSMRIPLEIPVQNYLGSSGAGAASPTSIHGRNADVSHSFINAGSITTGADGNVLLNGQSITDNQMIEEDCGNE